MAYFIKLFRSPFFSLAENSLALVNTLLLKIDEDEKVKLVQQKNNRLLLSLFKVLLSILIAMGIGSLPFIIYLIIQNQAYADLDFSSISSIIALSVGSTLGFIIPVKKSSSASYSELSQLLHRMALNNYAIAYKLFKVETKKLKKKGTSNQLQFVIVSGLARSGTTSLMNRLTENNLFASLSYANMPFLTAPNLWSKIYKPKNSEQKERSHNDGILIGLESNEALEEYFFKVVSNDAYIKEDTLIKYDLTQEQYLDYIKYQAIVRKEDQKIYLAKNNNFILRYDSIRTFNKDFKVVFMFRDPLSHAGSLLEKHKEYNELQKQDAFVLEYMNWLGHHEFGLNQKRFQFTEESQSYSSEKSGLDYWLQVWINYYSYLLTIDRSGVIFVDYDFYCQYPEKVLESIYEKLGVVVDLPKIKSYHNSREVKSNCSDDLKQKAYKIYAELKAYNL